MKLFIDNVPNLVVRAIIASALPSMFCPKSVFAMDVDLVNKIAEETEEKRSRRQEITDKLNALEAGNNLCKQYTLRVTSGESISIIKWPSLMCPALPIPKRIRSTSSVSSVWSNASVDPPEETPSGKGSDCSGSVHSIRSG
jgi:hypothetical protein